MFWTVVFLRAFGSEYGIYRAGEVSVRRAGDSVYVSLRLRVTDIGSDNLVTLTPVLYKGAGGVRSLPPVLYGSRRAQLRLWKKAKDKSAVPVCHNSGDTVFYRDTFRYEHWMNGSGLRLDAELRTCCRTMLPILYYWLRISFFLHLQRVSSCACGYCSCPVCRG